MQTQRLSPTRVIRHRAFVSLFALLAGTCVAGASSAMPNPREGGPIDVTVGSNGGAAGLSVPIAVPPGPGGFAPSLAVVYSSHGGDGPFGLGWRLPLDEVRCATRFGVPDYEAGCDQYEMNGELLVTEEAGTPVRYHTFVESFMRVLHQAGHWEVTRPDGTILRFGLTAQARVDVPTAGASRRAHGRRIGDGSVAARGDGGRARQPD